MSRTVSLISESRKDLLKLLLKDPRISNQILINGEIPQSIVIHDDGSVTFGRTPTKWWNWLFRDYTNKSFRDLAFDMRIAYAKYTPADSCMSQALDVDIIKYAVDQKAYDWVIDKFVMTAFLGVTEGDYLLRTLSEDKESRQPQREMRSNDSKTKMRGKLALNLGGDCMPIDIIVEEQ